MLMVYDNQVTDIAHMLSLFNNMHPNITFTMELEEDRKINFLDLTIHNHLLEFMPPFIENQLHQAISYTSNLVIPWSIN
jgi:hypothetical protein